jgi:ubiquinone/menaquinone biosynthesis C-methylase UbiE
VFKQSSEVSSFVKDRYSHLTVPDYLQHNYWWAYLSPIGVKFFDHPFIVNRVLWGNYHAIAQATVAQIKRLKPSKITGISCAYGEFLPQLIKHVDFTTLSLFDVAKIQLQQAQQKIRHAMSHPSNNNKTVHYFIADAEHIALPDNYCDTTILFFLLHELPEHVRQNALTEAIRITQPNGHIVITDYHHRGDQHLFHHSSIFRTVFESMEPCLKTFWNQPLQHQLQLANCPIKNKQVTLVHQQTFWHEFYQMSTVAVCPKTNT